MLSIIIGIVIIAVLIFVGIEIKINDTIFSVIFVVVVIGAGGIGLFYPAKGFTDWQLVKETELVTLSNSVASQGSGRMFYVSISADNVYSYRYEIESEFKTEGSKSYKVDTVSGDNVEEIEEANNALKILNSTIIKTQQINLITHLDNRINIFIKLNKDIDKKYPRNYSKIKNKPL